MGLMNFKYKALPRKDGPPRKTPTTPITFIGPKPALLRRASIMGIAILEAGSAFSHISAEAGSRSWATKEHNMMLQGCLPLKYEEGQSSFVRRRASLCR
jgi:hypothetical protein